MLHSFYTYDTAIIIALTIYTIIGLYFYLTGVFKNISVFKVAGGILLGLVILRLFPLAWELELVGRVIVFALIGILLMSTAFIGKINSKQLPRE